MLSKEEPFENFTSDALCLHDLSFFSAELTCGISLVNFGLGCSIPCTSENVLAKDVSIFCSALN
jgi:hypothetical protein